MHDSRYNVALMPVHEFSWWIIVCLLALHGVLAAIISELMGRTYGKWWLWFVIAISLPLIGPIVVLLYHWIVSTSVADARKATFWERVLWGGPVSLARALQREKARAVEVSLHNYSPPNTKSSVNHRDPEIEALLIRGKFSEARGHAWKMLEIARESGHSEQIARYQEYLEVIALRESEESGLDYSGK